MKKLFLFFAVLLATSVLFAQKAENLALTPPMGWNSWNTFGVEINEQLIKDIADIFVSTGLKEAGYEYVVLDDGWMDMQRDAHGNLLPHPVKFPNGIKAVADYVHSKGLKFGLYNCAGSKTCAGYPGSRGHEYQDAAKYAEWGADFLKYDWCNTEKLTTEGAYMTMRDALYATGRPFLFSICEWGGTSPWLWAAPIGHIWRSTGDIGPHFGDFKKNPNSWNPMSVLEIIDKNPQNEVRKYAGAGHWNDMDMLEVGNEGLDLYENQSHFALWAMLNSPLMLGNDLREMTKETLAILTNKDIISLNQDKLGIQGFIYAQEGAVQIFVKPLANGEWAVQFLNRSENPAELTFDWNGKTFKDEIFGYEIAFSKDNVRKIKDLYLGKEIGKTSSPTKIKLAKHQSLVVRLLK
ncbi:MAG: glycoside hydrolase family 27 protein [Dysgonamonadaceae bacterium]|jgi:alpha-galactosidase|nr:glycoside hydrolase family 27 protein [Dysgonamonadaceae bacterium]